MYCASGGSTGVGELGVLSITERGGGMRESARVSGGAQVI